MDISSKWKNMNRLQKILFWAALALLIYLSGGVIRAVRNKSGAINLASLAADAEAS